jgi:dihydrofolate synthase / folylpolyglutamate synthase
VNYPEALAWLYGLQRFGIKLGLENIQRLIGVLRVDLGRVRIIHVAGTNGKGSVCAMIDSILRTQQYRTGLFTSPHLLTFRERIRVDGKMMSEEAVANGVTTIRGLVRSWDPHPTFFEIATALALKHFSNAKIDIAILETGLGGRLDATNAVQSNVSVITSIDFDHQQWLGQSLREIATEKAGIIKPKVPVVSAPQAPDADKVIRARATECEAPLQFVNDSHQKTPVSLSGEYQKQNAALAIAALHDARIDIDDSSIARGLATVDWPGRFQKWDDHTIIDGAHNPAAAQILTKTWRELFGDQRATLVLAILSDKDLRGICEALAPISDFVLLPTIRSERAADPTELAKIISANTPSLPYSITPSVALALEQAHARANPILLTGSLHFAGEALAHLQGQPAAFEECAQ